MYFDDKGTNKGMKNQIYLNFSISVVCVSRFGLCKVHGNRIVLGGKVRGEQKILSRISEKG